MPGLDFFRQAYVSVVIAREVCRAAVRERMMYGFLLLALLFILMANVPFMVQDSRVFEGQPPAEAALQIGFVAINIFTLLITIFISLNTLQDFLSKERLSLLLSKPVRRWQILEGLMLGLFEMAFLNWCLMTAGVWLVIVSQTKSAGFYVWAGMSATLLLALLYVSLVVFFFCLVPSALAGVATIFVIIAGFGVTLSRNLFETAAYPSFLKRMLSLGLELLPKINGLFGLSMRSLGLFDIKIRPGPILLHTVILIFALHALAGLRFRRFGKS